MNTDRLTDQLSKWQSLDDLYRYFSTETRCRDFLFNVYYPNGIKCPKCGGEIVYKCGKIYHCEDCNHNFSVTVHTIFHSTKLPLRKWFAAIWLMTNNKKAINACMLSRELRITYATAWHMLRKIRCSMPQDDTPLKGTVQIDAAYVGGQLRWIASARRLSPHDYLRNKVSILGLVGDRLVIKAIPDDKWRSIKPILQQHLDPSTIVHTDSGKEFMRIGRDLGLLHHVVDHSRHQFSVDGVSTNKIEGTWAHLKRQVRGVYHLMPRKYAQCYIDEFVWRWNTRKLSSSDRTALFFSSTRVKITWKELKQST